MNGTTTEDRGQEKNRRPCNQFKGNCFNYGKNGHHARECRSAKKIEKPGGAATNKKEGGRGKCYVCEGEERFAHKHSGLCKSLEYRTRDYEERGAKKDAMMEKMKVSVNFEVGLMSAMAGAACGGG